MKAAKRLLEVEESKGDWRVAESLGEEDQQITF